MTLTKDICFPHRWAVGCLLWRFERKVTVLKTLHCIFSAMIWGSIDVICPFCVLSVTRYISYNRFIIIEWHLLAGYIVRSLLLRTELVADYCRRMTVYITKRTMRRIIHMFRVFVVIRCGLVMVELTNILQGYSTGTGVHIVWTNVGIFLIATFGTNFCESWIKIQPFSLMKMNLKASSAKWQPFYPAHSVSSSI